jgi:hypothetical protein
MKKVIRLTETELVNLVKKVINEEKKLIKESSTSMGGLTVVTTGKDTLKIGNSIYKTKIESAIYTGPVVITNIKEVPGTLYGTNYKFTTNQGQSKTFDKGEVDAAIKAGAGKAKFSMGGSLGKIILTKTA